MSKTWYPVNDYEKCVECGTCTDKNLHEVYHKEKALSYFENNFNCSQAVFTTFATEMGIDEDLALKLATQFGGGARCGQMCGAVSGALMVLGLKYGHCHSDNNEEKSRAYNLTVEFNKRFCEKNGSIVCKDLLGYNLSVPDEFAIIKEKKLFSTVCTKMIADATEIIEQLLNENIDCKSNMSESC